MLDIDGYCITIYTRSTSNHLRQWSGNGMPVPGYGHNEETEEMREAMQRLSQYLAISNTIILSPITKYPMMSICILYPPICYENY